MTTKEEKFFNGQEWYHGTTLSGWKSICELGIQAKYNIGISLDFGNGFYLSNSLTNTEKYVQNIIKYSAGAGDDGIPVIIKFSFKPMDWLENDLAYRYFAKYDDEFAEFVFENRLNCLEEKRHPYDITAGVMTDAKPTFLMQQYQMQRISKEEVIQELKRSTSAKQLCLHRQEQCDLIRPSEAYIFGGKELDVNEYCCKRS